MKKKWKMPLFGSLSLFAIRWAQYKRSVKSILPRRGVRSAESSWTDVVQSCMFIKVYFEKKNSLEIHCFVDFYGVGKVS